MLLWHYTSVDALVSILSNDDPTLRASHILHLNDTAELKHGLGAMKSLFKNQVDEPFDIQGLLDQMLNDEYDPEIYSFSLSGCEDSLYQWIAYCPNQGGIALGFEFTITSENEILQEELYLRMPATPGYVQVPQFGECHYFRNPNQVDPDWLVVKANKMAEPNLLTNAMFLKHEAFHFEKEYRLFFHPMPHNPHNIPIQFNGNKPFIDFHFHPQILKQIYVSPRGDKKITERTVKKILRVKDMEHVEIVVSDVPFRE